jgi:hypothetical protein
MMMDIFSIYREEIKEKDHPKGYRKARQTSEFIHSQPFTQVDQK